MTLWKGSAWEEEIQPTSTRLLRLHGPAAAQLQLGVTGYLRQSRAALLAGTTPLLDPPPVGQALLGPLLDDWMTGCSLRVRVF